MCFTTAPLLSSLHQYFFSSRTFLSVFGPSPPSPPTTPPTDIHNSLSGLIVSTTSGSEETGDYGWYDNLGHNFVSIIEQTKKTDGEGVIYSTLGQNPV